MNDSVLHMFAAAGFSTAILFIGWLLRRAISHLDTSIQGLAARSGETDVKLAEMSVKILRIEADILDLQNARRRRR